MAAYLYPELKSKKAYKDAIKAGQRIVAIDQGIFSDGTVSDGDITFEGPHYPKPHRYYGTATVKNGIVIAVK